LNFDRYSIYKHGVNGFYNLTSLLLYDENGTLMDNRYYAYTTAAYDYTDFQRLSVALTGSYSDNGTDTDGNGLYDHLTVDVEVIVENAGNYALNARIMDKRENEIVWAATTAWLSAGQAQIMQLNFNGKRINQHGANGPYYLRDVYVYNVAAVTQSDYEYDAYTTGAYNYTDFETILETDLPNVDLISADPTVTSINVASLNLSDVNETYKPAEVRSQSAYMIDATGSGNFTLKFMNISNANLIKVYKIDPSSVPANQWIELDDTTTVDTVTFMMKVGDPPVIFGTMPDLTLAPANIFFSATTPTEGDLVEITATVHNIGGADASDFTVSFFDGASLIGTATISAAANSATTASTTWTAVAGDRTIKVVADSGGAVAESDETNNEANKTITVKEKAVVVSPVPSYRPRRGGGGGGGGSRDTDGDGVSDVDEILAETDWKDASDYPGKAKEEAAVTPTPTPSPALTLTPTVTPAQPTTPTAVATPTTTPTTPTPQKKVPGFETSLAVFELLGVAYLLGRRRVHK